MGTHVMESSLLLGCLVALVIPANSIKCHTCVGDFNDCNPTEVTCPGKRDKCSTTALFIDSFPCKVQKVFKGCINSTTASKKLSISPNDLITLSLKQDLCKSDLCNTDEVSDPDSNPNDLYCYSCITPGTSCDSETMKEMRCRGEQNQCLDVQVTGSFGEIADVNLKGCGRIPACKSNLYFSSQTSSVSVQCCNDNYCNSGTEPEPENKTPNGIQCYSCNTLDGAKCSPEEVVKAQCYGGLTYCLEVAGINMKDERPIPTVIKGCATKSMCDSSVLPLLQKLGTATVKCCKGNLCNNQFTESGLIASGYVPLGNEPPETGIQNTSSDAIGHKHSGSPVKTGHHANNKYGIGCMPTSSSSYNHNNNNNEGFSEFNGPNMSPGNSNNQGIKGGSWNSNSNTGYPNPSFNSYNEFSDIGSVHNPSITTTQVDQGPSYNDLSVENPNSVYGSNVFLNGDQTTDNDGIFVESNTVFIPINSSGGDNVNALSTGGSAPGGEGESDTTTYSNSDDNSIPNAHPTFPDFTSYVDNSIVPNSYYDNNMNYPNNNDLSSYDSAGFTDVVFTELEYINLNDDQSSFSTVAPDSIVSNSYDSVGNSGSGYSADTVNIGSNVNAQGNNSSVQHLTPVTSKTHSYDIKQHISGYGTNTYNTGINNNGSGNYISSSGNYTAGSGNSSSVGTAGSFTDNNSHNVSNLSNYSSREDNLSTSSPGGSKLGGEGVPETTNSSFSDDSSIPDAPPTFPDFTSYGDDSTVSNSYFDNNMNYPNNIDFSSYGSAGFTDLVYTDINGNDDQSSFTTVAPNSMVSNSHGSVGNSVSGYSADNENNMNNPNNIDFSSYDSAGFTDIVFGDINWNDDQSSFTTVALDGMASNNYDSVGNSVNGYSADNDNNMNNPNNNDFSSYESAGFTEVVYADIDWNDDQSNSPTVASDISNSYDSIGNSSSDNSAYNQNILSSNNNKTSGYTDDIVNNSSYINQQENDGSIQHFTPATPKTYNSDINQQISGYGTDIHNTGIAYTNGSGKNISSSGNNTAGSGNSSSAGTANIFSESEIHNVSNPINYTSGVDNLSALSPGGSGGEVESDTTNYNNRNDSSFPNVLPTFPDFTSYVDNSIVPNSYYDNNMNYPNNNDFNAYDSAGFTDVVYTDIDFNDDQSISPTLATDNVVSNDYDSVGNSGSDNSAYKPSIISSANNNETSGYSDAMYIGSNVNVQGNNGSVQHLTPATSKTHNSGIKQHISGYGTNIYNMGTNNGSGNYISSSGNNTVGSGNSSSTGTANIFTDSEIHNVSSPIIYSSGENNLNALSPGGAHGEGVSDTPNYSKSDDSTIPDAPPTFPAITSFTSYGDNNIVPNSYYDNNMNYPNNNDFSSYESAGFTEVAYPDIDWNDNQSSSPTVAPDIVSNSYDSVGNSGSDDSAYNPNIISSHSNNETSGYSAVNINNNVNAQGNNGSIQHLIPATSKTHNSGIKQHISGYTTDIYNRGIANNNGSGNYISSSGNNTAGSGNNSSAGTSGSSSFGGYTNMPDGNESSTTNTSLENDAEMTDEWNNSNNSSKDNIEVPLDYANSGNATGMTNEWINSNDSNHNLGYNNILGNNDSSTSHTGNGTGMSNEWSHNNSFNPNMSVPGGYANIPGSNYSSTSHTSSGIGSGMTNEWINKNSSYHNMVPPGGNYGSFNSNDSNHFSNSNHSSNFGMPNNNGSTYGNGSSFGSSWNSNESYLNHMSSGANNNGSFVSNLMPPGMNHNGSGPSGYNVNSNFGMPNNGSTYGNGSSFGSSWNSNESYLNHMSSGANNNGSFVSNLMPPGMNHNGSGPSGYNVNSNFGRPNNGSTYGNGSSFGSSWNSNESYLNHMSSGANNNGSFVSNLMPPGMNHNGSGPSGYNVNSNFGMPNNGSTYGNGSSFGSSWNSNESYLNHMSSGANNNGSFVSNLMPPGMNHNGSGPSGYNVNSNFGMPNNGSTYGNGSTFGSSWNSIESYLNHMSSGANNNGSFVSNMMPPGMNHNGSGPSGYNVNSLYNGSINDYFNSMGIPWNNSNIPNIMSILSGGNNGSYFNTSSWPNGLLSGKFSFSNETAWMLGLNNTLNSLLNNNNNGSSSNHNNIQNFLSTLNGYIQSNGSKNITEWIQNNSFFSNLMPPGMNHNGSGPSGFNVNSLYNGSLNDYFKGLGISLNNSNIPNIMSILSGGNNGPFNISKFDSGWSNTMFNPNFMNPHENHNGSPDGSTNTNGYNGGAGFNGQPNSNTNGMSSGGYIDGSINGNGHNSYAMPPGGNNNTGASSNNGNNPNMIPGVGGSGASYGGASTNGNGYNTHLMGHGLNGSMLGNGSHSGGVLSNNYNPNELVPGRSTNESTGGGAAGDQNGMVNSASSFWMKSWSIVIFSAIALLVLN